MLIRIKFYEANAFNFKYKLASVFSELVKMTFIVTVLYTIYVYVYIYVYFFKATRDRLTRKRQERKSLLKTTTPASPTLSNDDSDSDDIPLSLFRPKVQKQGIYTYLHT